MIGPTGTLLERYLDLLATRQRIASSNIANADTPGYRAKQIDFQAEVDALLASPLPPARFPAALVREDWVAGARNDGNNVSLDHEMKTIAENVLHFTLASLLLQRKLRGLRSVIQEGR